MSQIQTVRDAKAWLADKGFHNPEDLSRHVPCRGQPWITTTAMYEAARLGELSICRFVAKNGAAHTSKIRCCFIFTSLQQWKRDKTHLFILYSFISSNTRQLRKASHDHRLLWRTLRCCQVAVRKWCCGGYMRARRRWAQPDAEGTFHFLLIFRHHIPCTSHANCSCLSLCLKGMSNGPSTRGEVAFLGGGCPRHLYPQQLRECPVVGGVCHGARSHRPVAHPQRCREQFYRNRRRGKRRQLRRSAAGNFCSSFCAVIPTNRSWTTCQAR